MGREFMIGAVLLVVGMSLSGASLAAAPSPEARAVSFLAREVPRWVEENGCRSCHNNGDAARALFEATRRGQDVPRQALENTLAWLRSPEEWDTNQGEPGFSDRVLERIQFASALLGAVEAGLVSDEGALDRAADLVASDQSEDGSWRLDASASIGSPATYGRVLASVTARRVLLAAGEERLAGPIARVSRWLREIEVETVIDAAALLMAVADAEDEPGREQRRRALDVIRRGQAPSGGWGPYVTSAPEPFDTALVMLALGRLGTDGELTERIARGRRFLLDSQLEDGSWVETTRPAGQQSYAQYISTTGWATLALLMR